MTLWTQVCCPRSTLAGLRCCNMLSPWSLHAATLVKHLSAIKQYYQPQHLHTRRLCLSRPGLLASVPEGLDRLRLPQISLTRMIRLADISMMTSLTMVMIQDRMFPHTPETNVIGGGQNAGVPATGHSLTVTGRRRSPATWNSSKDERCETV